jgi:competence protein ComEC
MMMNIRKQWMVLLIFFVMTLFVWGAVFYLSREGMLTVAFLDVGQGDAIFIETPNGTQVLIDSGPNKNVLRGLGNVMPFYDRTLDMIIATHPDLDHIGGFPSVLERFDVEKVVWTENTSESDTYKIFFNDVADEGAHVLYARRGRLILDPEHGVYLDVVFPDRNVGGLEANASSIVTKLVFGETSFLFTGDSPQAMERYVVSIAGENLDVDVLKLGHHGSKTSTSEEFLAYTTPEYAIVSAAKDNTFGHPHREVTDMLDVFEIKTLSTAELSTIVFKSDGVDVVLQ